MCFEMPSLNSIMATCVYTKRGFWSGIEENSSKTLDRMVPDLVDLHHLLGPHDPAGTSFIFSSFLFIFPRLDMLDMMIPLTKRSSNWLGFAVAIERGILYIEW